MTTGRWSRLGRLASLGPRAALAVGDPAALGAALEQTLGELKAGSLKLGQLLAQVADDFGPEVRGRLGRLYGEVPPLPLSAFADALAEVPAFASLDEVPLAAASLGQVHAGVLPDGTKVAVKLRYPGAEEALAADLDTLRRAAATVSLGDRLVQTGPVLAGLITDTLRELDYRAEARGRALLAGVVEGDGVGAEGTGMEGGTGSRARPRLRVATVFPGWSSERVLTMERVEGPTLHTWLASARSEAERRAVARCMVRAVLGPALRGVLNPDAHPGNFVVAPDGGLVLLDFGAVTEWPHGEALGALLRALRAGAPLAGPLDAVGMELRLPPPRRAAYAAEIAAILGPLLRGPVNLATAPVTPALGKLKQSHPRDTLGVHLQPHALPLARALLGLHHALRRLAVEVDVGAELAGPGAP